MVNLIKRSSQSYDETCCQDISEKILAQRKEEEEDISENITFQTMAWFENSLQAYDDTSSEHIREHIHVSNNGLV